MKEYMKKETNSTPAIRILLFFLLSIFYGTVLASGIGTWKNYLAYSEIQQIEKAGDNLFVMASNDLYQYNIKDEAIYTYDRTNGMSDIYITNIAWCNAAGRLVVIYKNSNIDLIKTNGNITNLSDIYSKNMTVDKTINNIYIYSKYAYLSTGFGVVKINVSNAEVSETYMLDRNITSVAVKGGFIYAKDSNNGVLKAALNENLIDKNNWNTDYDTDMSIFNKDMSAYNENIGLVSSLKPEGPKRNYTGKVKIINGKLYTVNGFIGAENPATLQMYDGNSWTSFETDLTDIIDHRFVNLLDIEVDPKDETHVFACGQTGLYEFKDTKFVREYSNYNSPLEEAYDIKINQGLTDKEKRAYVEVTTMKYDNGHNLWLANSYAENHSLFVMPQGKTELVSKHHANLMTTNKKYSMASMSNMMTDRRGIIWFTNNNYTMPALAKYYIQQDSSVVYKQVINQDGTKATLNVVPALAEDKDGNIWIGTDVGPFYIKSTDIGKSPDDMTFIQVKVPRNDGTNYADYLLSGVFITCIAVDGAGRKWFGTDNNGAYLISEDNMTEIHHFTKDNSGLLSNNVSSIAINGKTGEVFFGTDCGLCSYISDASDPNEEMDKNNVYAYPNPVKPDYNGNITVLGLSYNSDVKIITANGTLVAEGRSNGGTFTWNGLDMNGKRVASGIYMVVTAKEDGSKGTVCKIAVIR